MDNSYLTDSVFVRYYGYNFYVLFPSLAFASDFDALNELCSTVNSRVFIPNGAFCSIRRDIHGNSTGLYDMRYVAPAGSLYLCGDVDATFKVGNDLYELRTASKVEPHDVYSVAHLYLTSQRPYYSQYVNTFLYNFQRPERGVFYNAAFRSGYVSDKLPPCFNVAMKK